jgi:hypothetical protein
MRARVSCFVRRKYAEWQTWWPTDLGLGMITALTCLSVRKAMKW